MLILPLSYWLRLGNFGRNIYAQVLFLIGILAFVKIALFWKFRLYHISFRYTSLYEVIDVLKASFIAGLIFSFIGLMSEKLSFMSGFPRSVVFIDFMLTFLAGSSLRLFFRMAYFPRFVKDKKIKVLIVGAQESGEQLVREMLVFPGSNYIPVALVDEDPGRHGSIIHGVKVLGAKEKIPEIVKKFKIDEIIIASPEASPVCSKKIMEYARLSGVRNIKIAPDLFGGRAKGQYLTVLVIGGAGYIGSALVEKLLSQNHKVRVLDLLLYGAKPIEKFSNNPNFELAEYDFRRVDKVVEVMRGVDVVVHLGAIVGEQACDLNEKLTIDINLMATKMIAEVAKGSGVQRFIFASTCSVYGFSDRILDEGSKVNPPSLYAKTKMASEKILMELSGNDFATVILRFGTIYGLSGRTRFDLVVNLLTAKALLDKKITVYGGEQWRPFIHVDDAAKAITMVLDAPTAVIQNQVINVGSNQQNYTIQEVACIINRLLPLAEIVNMGPDADKRNYRVNFEKIKKTLNFEPKWSVEMGVKQIIESMMKGEIKDYRDPAYNNAKHLSEENLSCLVRNEIVL